jgi:hypothetical protein
VLLEEEASIVRGRNRFIEMFTIGRNRRAMLASCLVMFGREWRLPPPPRLVPDFPRSTLFFFPSLLLVFLGLLTHPEQFCGVNAIVYYTATIFTQAGFSNISALLASWGFGMLNWREWPFASAFPYTLIVSPKFEPIHTAFRSSCVSGRLGRGGQCQQSKHGYARARRKERRSQTLSMSGPELRLGRLLRETRHDRPWGPWRCPYSCLLTSLRHPGDPHYRQIW